MASLFGEETMKPKLLVFSTFDGVFVCIIVVLSVLLLITPFLNYNNQAILYMVQKKYDKAEQKWRQALNKKSLIPFYRMNLALNYLLNGQADTAIQEYTVTSNLVKQIEKQRRFKEQEGSRFHGDDGLHRESRPSREKPAPAKAWGENPAETEGKNPKKQHISARDLLDQYKKKVLFYSFFNSAIAATVKKEIKKALSLYQKALRVQPESLEVKTNIELLMSEKSPSKDQKESSEDSGDQKEESKKAGENKESGESQNQEKKDKENKQAGSDATKDEKTEEQKKEKGSDSEKQKGSSKKNSIDEKQREAILKAILEGEKKIRERRNKSGKSSSAIEKDW